MCPQRGTHTHAHTYTHAHTNTQTRKHANTSRPWTYGNDDEKEKTSSSDTSLWVHTSLIEGFESLSGVPKNECTTTAFLQQRTRTERLVPSRVCTKVASRTHNSGIITGAPDVTEAPRWGFTQPAAACVPQAHCAAKYAHGAGHRRCGLPSAKRPQSA
jgi:hypothetical protein